MLAYEFRSSFEKYSRSKLSDYQDSSKLKLGDLRDYFNYLNEQNRA